MSSKLKKNISIFLGEKKAGQSSKVMVPRNVVVVPQPPLSFGGAQMQLLIDLQKERFASIWL